MNNKAMEWISVKRYLPDEGEPVLCFTGNRKVMVCANRPLNDWFINKYSVTHWAYIVEPELA